jgi:hypothetical protein
MVCIAFRIAGRVDEEFFLLSEAFHGKECLSDLDHGDVVMPAEPTTTFVVIEPQLFFGLLVILLAVPAQHRVADQAAKACGFREVGEPVMLRFVCAYWPVNQDPDHRLLGRLLDVTVGWLHSQRGKPRPQGSFSPSPPCDGPICPRWQAPSNF